jgi:hypothetical protein
VLAIVKQVAKDRGPVDFDNPRYVAVIDLLEAKQRRGADQRPVVSNVHLAEPADGRDVAVGGIRTTGQQQAPGASQSPQRC